MHPHIRIRIACCPTYTALQPPYRLESRSPPSSLPLPAHCTSSSGCTTSLRLLLSAKLPLLRYVRYEEAKGAEEQWRFPRERRGRISRSSTRQAVERHGLSVSVEPRGTLSSQDSGGKRFVRATVLVEDTQTDILSIWQWSCLVQEDLWLLHFRMRRSVLLSDSEPSV
jgi:hypothetical protein